jgi:hypothetical protein
MTKQILDKKFTQWTEGKDPIQARIKIYEQVRNIPYAVIPDLNDNQRFAEILTYGRGSCTPKHLLLGHMFEKLGLTVLYAVFPYRWDHVKFDYPPRLRELAQKTPSAYHLACRVDIDGEMILVDATLDPLLEKLGLPVNKSWDGISNTILPIIPEGEEELYHPSEALLTKKSDPDENTLAFYDALNRLLEEGRHL